MKFIRISKRHLSKIWSAFLQIFSGEPWNDVWEGGQLKKYLHELAGNKNSLSFGLFDKNELIAISLGRIKHWCGGTEYCIEEFGVIPPWQGKGIGSEFLSRIQSARCAKGIRAIILQTERSVPAYRFYKKCGFEEQTEKAFFAKYPEE